MDLQKLKVVELRAELQARDLDTKGVKAVLIDRLKEALDEEARNNESSGGAPFIPLASESEPVQQSEPVTTPDTPSRRRRSSRSKTKSPSPTRALKMEPPVLAPVSEEVTEALEPELLDDDDEEMSTERADSEMIDEDALLSDEPAKMEVEVAKQEDKPVDESKKEDNGEQKDGDDERRGKKRSRSPSNTKQIAPKKRYSAPNIDDFVNEEDEPELDESLIQLSWFDSDLNLKINREGFNSASSMSESGLALVWAGARANYGVKANGKYFYEVQLTSSNNSIHYPNEKRLHEFRCGWSTEDTSLQLGESVLSYGLDNSGKKCTNCVFTDYAAKFGSDDVIGVHLDLNDEKCSIQFTVNGKDGGVAFEFEKSELNDQALFPHLATKNFGYKVNFGKAAENFWVKRRGTVKVQELKRRRDELEKKKKDQEKLKQKRVDQKAKAEAKRVEAAAKALETAAAAAENPEDPEAPKEDITETSEEVPAATLSNGEEAKPAEEKIEEAEPVYEVFADDITEEEIEAEIPQIHQLSGFNYVSLCEISELVRGPQRPEFRKDCEVILLIGLPGAGKSHWAVEKTKAQPEKRYNVLGTKFLLEKMKLQGEARKPSNSGRWEKLIELCNRALLVLTDIACKRRRNYILDQPHVYTSAQRRKMRVFGDFVRIAMIIVPDEEEYKKRFDLRLKVEGKDIPESAVCEMKSNFSLPEMEYLWFSEIQYSDLDGEKAKAEVVKENEKGKKAAHRGRNDFNRGGPGRPDFNRRPDARSRWGPGGNDFNRRPPGDRWMPPGGPRMPHGPPGGFRHHGGDRRGGWGQDNWNNNRGQNRGGYGGAPPPRPGRKPGDNNRDSRQNNDRRNDRQDNNRGGNARPAAGNNKNVRGGATAGNGKFDQRRDGGGRNYGGNSGSWNNYGGNNYNNQWQQGGGNNWNSNSATGTDASYNGASSGDANQQWFNYYQQQQIGGSGWPQQQQPAQQQQNWYTDQNYGGAYSSQTFDAQSKQ